MLLPILSPKNDFVFKQIFGDPNHKGPISAFLQATLQLPAEEFLELTISDPNLDPNFKDDKSCVLDVRIKTLSQHDIDVEIQIYITPELCNRLQFYVARMVAEKLSSGDDYIDLPQSICIVIVDGNLWPTKGYHHCFQLYDVKNQIHYPNSLEIHTLELRKLPQTSDGTNLWDWMRFFTLKERAEFVSFAERGGAMADAVEKLLKLSLDESARLQAISREKFLMDQETRMRSSFKQGEAKGRAEGRVEGRAEGRVEVAHSMIQNNQPLDLIAKVTKLSLEEVKRLFEEENN